MQDQVIELMENLKNSNDQIKLLQDQQAEILNDKIAKLELTLVEIKVKNSDHDVLQKDLQRQIDQLMGESNSGDEDDNEPSKKAS